MVGITRQRFEMIKAVYGKKGSWAIWNMATDDKITDVSMFDNPTDELLGKLQPTTVIIGMNTGSPIKKDFEDWHTARPPDEGNPGGEDLAEEEDDGYKAKGGPANSVWKLAKAIKHVHGGMLEGVWLTDLFRDVAPKAEVVKKKVKDNPNDPDHGVTGYLEKSKMRLFQEILSVCGANPIMFAFGQFAVS